MVSFDNSSIARKTVTFLTQVDFVFEGPQAYLGDIPISIISAELFEVEQYLLKL